MFPEPPRPVLRLSQQYRSIVGAKPSYSAHKSRTRTQCDECLWVLHESRGLGELPRTGTVRRRTEHGDIILCYGHTQLWKELDGTDH